MNTEVDYDLMLEVAGLTYESFETIESDLAKKGTYLFEGGELQLDALKSADLSNIAALSHIEDFDALLSDLEEIASAAERAADAYSAANTSTASSSTSVTDCFKESYKEEKAIDN